MPGSRPGSLKRNHPGDQSRRASHTRASVSRPAGARLVNSTTADLGPAAVAFTLQRVEYNQCVEYELMEVGSQRDVKEYFAELAADVLDNHYGFDTPMPVLAEKISNVLEERTAQRRDRPDEPFVPIDELLDLQYITLGQITPTRERHVAARPPPANSPDFAGAATWEQYDATVTENGKQKTLHFVQSPQALVRAPIPSAVLYRHENVDAAAMPHHSSHWHSRSSLLPTQASHTTLPTLDFSLATPYARFRAIPRQALLP